MVGKPMTPSSRRASGERISVGGSVKKAMTPKGAAATPRNTGKKTPGATSVGGGSAKKVLPMSSGKKANVSTAPPEDSEEEEEEEEEEKEEEEGSEEEESDENGGDYEEEENSGGGAHSKGGLRDGITQKEIESIVSNEGSEMKSVLEDLREQVADIRSAIAEVRERVKKKELPTNNGVSYLECKLDMLVSYCTSLSFYLLLKAEGMSISEHPVVRQLMEVRTLMEKMRPLDAKLKYQLDKLLRAPMTDVEGEGAADALSFKPNPDYLQMLEGPEARDGGDGGEGGDAESRPKNVLSGDADQVYKAPRINAVHFEDKEAAKERRRAEKRAIKASKSEIVAALRDEFSDAPVEMASIGSMSAIKDKEDEHRIRFEEENMTRVTVSKKERKRVAKVKEGGKFEEAGLGGGWDDIRGLGAEMHQEGGGGEDEEFFSGNKRSLRDAYEGGGGAKKRKGGGGDGNRGKSRGGGRGGGGGGGGGWGGL